MLSTTEKRKKARQTMIVKCVTSTKRLVPNYLTLEQFKVYCKEVQELEWFDLCKEVHCCKAID